MVDRNHLKLCIPIEDRPRGGMYSFLSNMRNYLAQHGIPVTNDVADDYDVLFINSFMVPYSVIEEAKIRLPRLRVIQRVDGSARDYGRTDDADARQARVNMLADLTIFQSQYGKYATTQKYRVISHDGPIIYNPVDIHSFRPDGQHIELPGRLRVCYVTFSTNPRKGAPSLYTVARSNPDIDFILIGRYNDPPPLGNVHLLGVLDRETLPKALRACDVFVTFSDNEACPNTVLEALASGLPVLYKDSGGTSELVGKCGLPVTVDNFRQQLEAVLERRDELSKAARERAVQRFSPDHIFPQYLEAMDRAKRRSVPSCRDLIRASLRGYPVLPYRPRQLFWCVRRWCIEKVLARVR